MSTWLLSVALPAQAFAPAAGSIPTAPTSAEAVPVGLEPQRIFVTHPAEQGRRLAGPTWRAFRDTDGAGWSARFDEGTGTARYLWGRGIPLPADRDALVGALTAILERHPDLFGLRGGTLRLRSANHVARVDTWYVELDVLRDGVPTWRGGIGARVKAGHLIQLTVGTAPDAPVTGRWVLGAAGAIRRAIASGPAPSAAHTDTTAERQLLERRAPGLELRRTWLVRSRTADPPGRWVTFVDAETGEVLSIHDEVRWASGTITGRHHERTVDGSPLVTSPLPWVQVSGDTDVATTDENGDYTLAGGGPYQTDLDGDYVDVRNADGGEGDLSGSTPDLQWSAGDATQAEIDSYVFLNHMKAWGDRYAPEVPWVQGPIVSEVNLGSTCNAYWDGDVHFFSAGGGCNNTGQIADVNYHEWGHGFHYESLQGGTFDGSLSEGAGDTASFLQTDDSELGPYFMTNGAATRDVAPDQRYPQDFSNSQSAVHANGLIFGGSFWDLLQLLQQDEGDEGGIASTSHVYVGTLKGGPDIPGSFYEALVADDDDGDLENGTPHICRIYEAFGRHGLGTDLDIEAVLVSHAPIEAAEAQVDVPVALELLSVAEGCEPVAARAATVHYRVDGGAWQQEPLDTPGQQVEGVIPAQDAHRFVEYYVTGTTDGGDPFAAPAGEQIAPYSFFVGGTLEVRCDDFEADDGGYTSDVLSGSGADDWAWGTPTGQGGDPAGAFSGTHAWGTDLGLGAGDDGAYAADRTTRLRSPPVDTAHYTGVFLQYRRWLQVEDGEQDQAVITVDDAPVWTNWVGPGERGEDHLDGAWSSHSVPLGGAADQRPAVRIGFELHGDSRVQHGGWTIDDVCVLAPDTPDNRLGISDFAVEAAADTVAKLTWTQPRHGPVQAVRVVRKAGGWPTGPDDGEVAEELDAPEVGEPVEVRDVNGRPGTTYYAVYGFDGQHWLSWTVEGWNAAQVDLVGGPVPASDAWGEDGGETAGTSSIGGCSCGGTPARTTFGAWTLAAGIVAVRRRRVSPKVR